MCTGLPGRSITLHNVHVLSFTILLHDARHLDDSWLDTSDDADNAPHLHEDATRVQTLATASFTLYRLVEPHNCCPKKKTMYLHVLFAKRYFPSGELHTCKTFPDEPRRRSSQSSLATLAMTVLSLSSPWLLLSCPPLTDDRGI